jgi:hypothetical protein
MLYAGRNPFVNQVSSFVAPKVAPKPGPKKARRNPFVNQVSSFLSTKAEQYTAQFSQSKVVIPS